MHAESTPSLQYNAEAVARSAVSLSPPGGHPIRMWGSYYGRVTVFRTDIFTHSLTWLRAWPVSLSTSDVLPVQTVSSHILIAHIYTRILYTAVSSTAVYASIEHHIRVYFISIDFDLLTSTLAGLNRRVLLLVQ